MASSSELVSSAESYLGKSGSFVWNHYEELPKGSPWCCGFVSYIFEKIGAKKLFYGGKPVFYVPYAQVWCETHLRHVKMTEAEPGDIVIFTWSGKGYNSAPSGLSRDHIGFIRKKGTNKIAYTIEGNTKGGIVAERSRSLPYIYAIYRPKWKEAAKNLSKIYKAIDVSEYQGKIDWKKVKASGIDAAIIRYADGDHIDSYFKTNMKNATAAGVHVGCYIFSRARTKAEVKKEAKRLFDAAKPYNVDMPLYLDMEWEGQAKVAQSLAETYCSYMKKLGAAGGIYASLKWWKLEKHLNADKLAAYPLWIAQYNSKCTYSNYKSYFGMWQYSSSGKVDGIKGRVDMDKLYIAYWTKKKPKAETSELTTKEWINILKKKAAALKAKGYTYDPSPNGKKLKTNCAGYISKSLITAGLLPKGADFWLSDSINGESKDEFRNKKKFEVSYPNKRPGSAGLKVGDICGFAWGKGKIDGKFAHVHTMVYGGKNKKGQHIWYSYSAKNSEFKEPEVKPTYTTRPVKVLIRIKNLK